MRAVSVAALVGAVFLVVRVPAQASGGGPVTAMEICISNPPPTPSNPNHFTEYVTGVFEAPLETLGRVPGVEGAFAAYLQSAYQYARAAITCEPIWTLEGAPLAQKRIQNNDFDKRVKIIYTGWRYGQPPLTQGQSGFNPLVQGPGGLDVAQHRLTTYYCRLAAPGGTTMAQTDPALANERTYISPVFQADWNATAVGDAWLAFIRSHYVHDLGPRYSKGVACTANSPAIQAMMHQRALISSAGDNIVPVDWTYHAS